MPAFERTRSLCPPGPAAAGAGFAALPPARGGAEVRKARGSPARGRLRRMLARAGALAPWLAELAGAGAIPAGPAPWHDESALEHTAQVMDRLAGDELPAGWPWSRHGKTGTPGAPQRHHGHDAWARPGSGQMGRRLA
jgi:tRNA nucleotidyltransferase (CCA-adding enzyme)